MATSEPGVIRIEVWPHPGAGDPRGSALARDAAQAGVPVWKARSARIYFIDAPLSPAQVELVRARLLTDPVLEESHVGARDAALGEQIVEVHPLPGVMDPVAQTIETMVTELTGVKGVRASSASRFDVGGVDRAAAEALARRLLFNPVIEAAYFEAHTPAHLSRASRSGPSHPRQIALRAMDDAQLADLSRSAHLFLSAAEMAAIRAHYRAQERDPTDIELETIAQTWSEHCVHKTLKSTVRYRDARPAGSPPDPIRWEGRPGVTVHPDGSVTIANLLKSTVAAATHELIASGVDWTLSVFSDNSGVIAFDEQWGVCVKVETHNHPSAIEPYGGSATGIGGCIRDVIGTGLGAKPIASTDVFCVAPPEAFTTEHTENQRGTGGRAETSDSRSTPHLPSVASVHSVVKPLPPGCLHPRRVLTRVVDGVRDYGNRMGIPTVNGAVFFDDRYVGNPLVYCGCVGLIPRDRVHGAARPGDRIVALGGRTGRDGIHGATFSSAELTDTHADEFSHAVQIGNAIEQKRLLDAILRARDVPGGPLFSAITDCGAGGFSSAVGEMGARLGAEVQLDRAPLKYSGLRYDEIWISESQERMILAVPPERLQALRAICQEESCELADLGVFGTPDRQLILRHHLTEVGRLSMDFLHDGLPMPTREAVWSPPAPREASVSGGAGFQPASSSSHTRTNAPDEIRSTLLALLAHPTIASKRWIVRQYDHEVQGNTVIKPLVGPGGIGPGDASVIQPVPGSSRGLAIACGMATGIGDPAQGGDPYLMALAAVDECVRNLVCVGADPSRIAILDNFCWPSCEKPQNMASLVRAAVGCYDAAKAHRTPFVSGKDSLNNQFRYRDASTGREVTIEIPPTLLITGIAIVPDVSRCVTMEAKRAGNSLALVGALKPTPMRGSTYDACVGLPDEADDDGQSVRELPRPDPALGAGAARAVRAIMDLGVVRAAHDVSEGGLLVALSEMLIAGSTPERAFGASIGFQGGSPDIAELFSEVPHAYLLELEVGESEAELDRLNELATREGVSIDVIGHLTSDGRLSVLTSSGAREEIPVADLRRAFLGTLDW